MHGGAFGTVSRFSHQQNEGSDGEEHDAQQAKGADEGNHRRLALHQAEQGGVGLLRGGKRPLCFGLREEPVLIPALQVELLGQLQLAGFGLRKTSWRQFEDLML